MLVCNQDVSEKVVPVHVHVHVIRSMLRCTKNAALYKECLIGQSLCSTMEAMPYQIFPRNISEQHLVRNYDGGNLVDGMSSWSPNFLLENNEENVPSAQTRL